MLNNGTVLDTGYVIYAPERNEYYIANVGLFRTQVNPQKQCDHHNKVYGTNWGVVKVNLVVTQE